MVAAEAARLHARDIGGDWFFVEDTHSMEPVLWGGDWIVVDTRATFDSVKMGKIIVYRAEWAESGGPPVVHRAVEKDRHGIIASADNVRGGAENKYRVTPDRLIGVVVAVYRPKSL